ncbi:MAG: hypothetical protein KDD61_16245 [Bdellovibrionales bacterium]|nr:hypothetical protein [Bdellovibrionales bacterium]
MTRSLRVSILFLICGFIFTSDASPIRKGEWSGSGGDGYAFVFTNLGYRLHRELLMEPYKPHQRQVRDDMSLAHFLGAVDNTKVIVTSEDIADKHGHEQTAIYYSPDELRALYKKKGKSRSEIETIIKDFPGGLIVVQGERFQNELRENMAAAFATVFHEYRRVLGLEEDNYRSSASRYDLEFFEDLQHKFSSVTQEVVRQARQEDQIAVSKMEKIDREKQRIEKELKEDYAELAQVRKSRRPFVDAARKSYSKLMNAYADVLDTMGIVAMPFPSAYSDTVSALGEAGSAGMDMEQKLSELEVINLQSQFLEGNIRRNMDFYEKIDLLRQKLFLDSLK